MAPTSVTKLKKLKNSFNEETLAIFKKKKSSFVKNPLSDGKNIIKDRSSIPSIFQFFLKKVVI
jgi:hypothetical protein